MQFVREADETQRMLDECAFAVGVVLGDALCPDAVFPRQRHHRILVGDECNARSFAH